MGQGIAPDSCASHGVYFVHTVPHVGWEVAMADLTWFKAPRATPVLACDIHKACQNCWVVLRTALTPGHS